MKPLWPEIRLWLTLAVLACVALAYVLTCRAGADPNCPYDYRSEAWSAMRWLDPEYCPATAGEKLSWWAAKYWGLETPDSDPGQVHRFWQFDIFALGDISDLGGKIQPVNSWGYHVQPVYDAGGGVYALFDLHLGCDDTFGFVAGTYLIKGDLRLRSETVRDPNIVWQYNWSDFFAAAGRDFADPNT